jgi:hypothetical protein
MVLSYSYLWHREQTKGETEGRKDRPSAVVLVLNRTGFGDVVYVLPTTTSEPKADDPWTLEIPRSIKVDESCLTAGAGHSASPSSSVNR